MASTVYIETTVPSFYYEIRTEPEMVARRQWTREWWDVQRSRYQVVTSEAVLDELNRGSFAGRDDVIQLLDGIPILSIDDAIAEIVSTYVKHKVMPSDPAGDALHLAVASYHGCDFLLTWNC